MHKGKEEEATMMYSTTEMLLKRRKTTGKKKRKKRKGDDQDQGLPLNPSNVDFFFEAKPSGGMSHALFCSPEELADPNDRPGFSGKLRPCEEEDGLEKLLIMIGMEFTDLVADDEESEK